MIFCSRILRLAASMWLAAALLVGPAAVYAQERPERAAERRFWFRPGFEFAVGENEFAGFSVSGVASYQVGENGMLSARGFFGEEFDSFLGSARPLKQRWDVGLLYGRFHRSSSLLVSAAAGVALVGGMNRGALLEEGGLFESDRYEKRPFLTGGVPIEAQFTGILFSSLGFGFHLSGNLNLESPFFGFGVHLIVGRL